ncbi:hypothetical protein Prubr_14020 [Polymorphospora rubra]|uniref:Mycothiol S-conjugate amidase n=1 Tax=Polymorphospora rubra TaxID=338584 RepID=A0A810MTI5_9ACTN|nr:hypothetical protein Prubr_14020 [Polymorphospora rubra]
MAEQLRLMAVHAHPDDESSKGAATMAKYVAEGVEVLVVTCTGGERGSVLNPKLDRPDVWENIAEIRRAEMDAARAILGVEQAWLGFVDSGLPEGDPLPPLPDGCFGLQDAQVAAGPLVRLMREFRPHVVTTYDEDGGYPHPDHIMCHKISVAAFEAAGDPDRFPDLGDPWQPLKLYYCMGFSKARVVALHEAMLAADLESPYAEWLEKWEDRGTRGPGSPPGSSARTTSRCATTRCGPTRPRSTRTASGSTSRWRCSARRGRPRTSNWSVRWSTARYRSPISSRASGRPSTRAEQGQAYGGRHTYNVGPVAGGAAGPGAGSVVRSGVRRDGGTVMLTAAQVLAQNNFGNTRSGGLAGPMGLFLIILLAIVTVLLIRNMNSRLRRLPERFPAPGEDAQAGTVEAEALAVDTVAGPTESGAGPRIRRNSKPVDRVRPGRFRGVHHLGGGHARDHGSGKRARRPLLHPCALA